MSDTTGTGPEIAVGSTDAERQRGLLVDEKVHLLAEIGDLHVGDPTEAHDENFADSGQVAAEQGETMALAGRLRDQLDDVALALDKLDAGTYGRCEVCGEPIGEDRLEAMPAARYCIRHAG